MQNVKEAKRQSAARNFCWTTSRSPPTSNLNGVSAVGEVPSTPRARFPSRKTVINTFVCASFACSNFRLSAFLSLYLSVLASLAWLSFSLALFFSLVVSHAALLSVCLSQLVKTADDLKFICRIPRCAGARRGVWANPLQGGATLQPFGFCDLFN